MRRVVIAGCSVSAPEEVTALERIRVSSRPQRRRRPVPFDLRTHSGRPMPHRPLSRELRRPPCHRFYASYRSLNSAGRTWAAWVARTPPWAR
ncbi:hypothetical protein FKO01_60285 [Mesorhizobium sp. B2-3-3]|nr:hypothetical protein FKO01_60285 [Mesorhizobium sp. B2-3-3]